LSAVNRPFSRTFETSALVLGGLALVAKVAVASGAPMTWLVATLCGAAVASLLTVALGGGRWLEAYRLPLVLVALWSLPDVYPKLGGDGYEYYVVARSVLFDHDLDLTNDFAGLRAHQVVSQLGEATSRTPIGVGLLWTPALILTHVGVKFARLVGVDVPADGFSAPYQAAATATTFLCAVLALFLVDAVLRRFYSRAIALLVALALWFATPLRFYAVVNPFMSHGASVFSATSFVCLWLAWRRSTEAWRWIVLGMVGGVMTLVRIQDGVLLILPLVDVGLERPPGWVRRSGAMLMGPVLAGLLQALIWARLWGSDFIADVGQQNLVAHRLNVMGVLFSPRHGLFTWTPLWGAAVLGLLLWLRRDRHLALPMILAFSLAVFLNSSMGDWWGSDGFGQRRFLGLTCLFALGVAEVLEHLLARPLLPIALILGALAFWNHQFATIYNRQMVAGKNESVTLDRLASAQVELLWRSVLAWRNQLPAWLFVLTYDNLKGVWVDEGTPTRVGIGLDDLNSEPPLFLGHGWRPPASEAGVGFRSTWGRKSWLTVLLKTPADFTLFVRARSEVPGQAVAVRVDVNEVSVGEAEAPTFWSDLEFRVPSATLRPGLNQLVLTADKTARALDPTHRAKNTALSVQLLRFRRIPASETGIGTAVSSGRGEGRSEAPDGTITATPPHQ
jgi:hypothetical protein